MTDMDKLIAAVEAGGLDLDRGLRSRVLGHKGCAALCKRAFHGSLDAAKRLHDALLPGWNYCHQNDAASVWKWNEGAQSVWDTAIFSAEMPGHPARAWLLAILKAVNAQERKT